MCRLCSADENECKLEQDSCRAKADRLERLASHYRAMADGRLKPHSPDMDKPKSLALSLIRELVEEWV